MPLMKVKPQTKKRIKQLLIVLLILFVILSFRPVAQGVANGVGNALNWPAEKREEAGEAIATYSKVAAAVVAGVVLLKVGVALAASAIVGVAVVGVVLVVAAVALIGWAAWKIWGAASEELPKGQKPDGVSLGGPL